ncbi:hypothetical protein Tco_1008161 [Tanacetum coccineum]
MLSLGGSVVEVDDGVSDSNNEDDDVVSEDGEVIDGVKVSKGEDLGKSDDVASRDGEGSTEIENEGEVKVSDSRNALRLRRLVSLLEWELTQVRAIWTLANALEYGREDLRKLLDGG